MRPNDVNVRLFAKPSRRTLASKFGSVRTQTMNPAKGHRNLRIGRFSEAGRIYLITTTTLNRTAVFLDFNVARSAIKAFTSERALKDSTLICWVLMPDHVHWLIQLGEDTLSKTVMRMKSLSARAVNQQRGISEQLWQHALHDHALRQEEDLKETSRYIVANPLRAGLVNTPGNYPFWDAIWL